MTFDEWWIPMCADAEVEPSSEEEGFARAAWSVARDEHYRAGVEAALEAVNEFRKGTLPKASSDGVLVIVRNAIRALLPSEEGETDAK